MRGAGDGPCRLDVEISQSQRRRNGGTHIEAKRPYQHQQAMVAVAASSATDKVSDLLASAHEVKSRRPQVCPVS